MSQEYVCANLSLKQIPLSGSLLCRLASLQVLIDPRRHFPAFGNRPDNERGAAFSVAAGKDAVEVAHEVLVDCHSPARVILHTQAIEQTVLDGTGKAHRQQHQIGIHLELGVGNRRELTVFELHAMRMQFGDMPIVAGELGRGDTPLPVTAFFMGMRRTELHRPERPGGRVGPLRRGLR